MIGFTLARDATMTTSGTSPDAAAVASLDVTFVLSAVVELLRVHPANASIAAVQITTARNDFFMRSMCSTPAVDNPP